MERFYGFDLGDAESAVSLLKKNEKPEQVIGSADLDFHPRISSASAKIGSADRSPTEQDLAQD